MTHERLDEEYAQTDRFDCERLRVVDDPRALEEAFSEYVEGPRGQSGERREHGTRMESGFKS